MSGRRHRIAAGALALAAGLAPGPAAAHLIGLEFGDFYGGALHLLTGIEYVAPLIGLALLAALNPPEAARWALPALPAGLALGALAALALGRGPAEAPLVAAAIAAAGLLAALAARLPGAAFAGLAGAVGLGLGYANGLAGLEGEIDARLFAPGIAVAGAAVLTLAAAGGTALIGRLPGAALVARVLGAWIGALGLVTLGLAVAGG